MTIMQPLYNYDSEENSYLVPDYPYGGKRCRIRFWVEFGGPKKGFRFCSQTENPKTLRWNAPRKGTYCPLALCLYLDENGHCVYDALSYSSSPAKILEFLKAFPQAPNNDLRTHCLLGKILSGKIANGKAIFAINGVADPPSENRIREAEEEVILWDRCLELLGTVKT